MNASFSQRLASDQRGFTLIELLLVMLIIGILAAIAIPAFLGQRQKAQDSSAKSMVRNAASAFETFATDKGGDYTGGDFTTLKGIEPSLQDTTNITAVTSGQGVEVVSAGTGGYSIYTKSKSGAIFNITKTAGNPVYRCKTATACTANPGW